MDTVLNLLSLFGSLALFLFGMKTMSEGLEKFAGDRLRAILAAMTKNRVMGVVTGIVITAMIQSSSATTVMVVSFVNAGLMTLTQAIGVIMGANVGTTVTAWMISAIGFKVNIAALTLPLMCVGMPLIFSSVSKRKSVGEFIFGFAFLFMGLSYLQQSATDLNIGSYVANLLAGMADGGFLTILLFVVVGALVTMLVQASAATMAITLMLFDMHIQGFGFEQAAALAMGQNIGTTITAFMASLTANTQAKRAALAHMFFNVFGVLVVLIMFYPFCDAVTWIVTNVLHAGDNDLFRLSAFHTAFNIFNTLLLIGFVKQIEAFVCKVLPMPENQDAENRLLFISGGLLSTAELSILQANKEIVVFGERCRRMLTFVPKALECKKEEDFENAYKKLVHYEQITDNMEDEIGKYLGLVSEGRLSGESKNAIACMLREIGELESIGDSIYHLGRTLSRLREYGEETFNEEQNTYINKALKIVDESLVAMINVLSLPEEKTVNLKENIGIEDRLNELRTRCTERNVEAINNKEYSYRLGTYYIDFINECEKAGDYVMNVVQAVAKMRE
ncbi:MAG: Na/Pi cotransporter family protein [Paludibacteraceae bacterium]|jgi:phosphate:Na+ symporter|nr:Na/Pi cotransporter family protein [Paludibacteraceae bacterium]MBO7627169.1 Na/Pi cotransporter family protein [Paludibacteraceae bacterium]MBP5526206.1 Na/Pi cotransporter family protein [Paludibacteraceae bacterium]MBQ8019191.1 Na/Pi cotransporter family protein [Paludibacteraceae bacterium]MBR6111789.1 Na/Pi cotransporter family protein [Paludibacteraceae bacterium]